MANAKIINHNGYPAISIDGKLFPRMSALITTSKVTLGSKERIIDKEYYQELGAAGINIFYICCNNLDIDENAVQDFYNEAAALLEVVPDAYIMVRLALDPSEKWMQENPDEIVQYSDGRKIHTKIRSSAAIVEHDGMFSLCSEKWRTDMGKTLLKTIERIKELPCGDRIAGYFLAAGGTSEWYYYNPLEFHETGAYADVSPAFEKNLKKYLDRKCGAGAKKPVIPDAQKRYFADRVDKDISTQTMWYGLPTPKPPQKDGNFGSFLDIDKYPEVYDFYRALNEGTADTIIHFAELIKKNDPGYLVGAFYGSMGGSRIVWFGNSAASLKILDSGYVDFLANPGVYENRQPGGFEGQRQCPDSFRLRNTMYVVEDGTRTHLENTFFGEMVEMFTAEDSVNVLKRNFGRNICEDLHAWWFDQHIGGGRYKFPEAYKLFKRQGEIADLAYTLDRRKENEIAFIYDEESIHTASEQTLDDCVQLIRNYEIANIGAGVDSYFHDDMANPAMPDYKLYVFCNCFYLSDGERRAIREKLKKNNATALFLYGNGLINPDREKMLDVSHVSELTGIECRLLYENHSPMFKIDRGSHEITDRLDADKIYGAFLKQRKSNVPYVPLSMPRSYLYPLIYGDDPAGTVFAHYAKIGLPAAVIKENDGFTSIYCGSKYITADFLREAARFAGCHIYEEDGHVLHVSKNFLTVHAAKSGKVKISLKKPCSPFELYEKKYYGRDCDAFSFFMRKGETKMFQL